MFNAYGGKNNASEEDIRNALIEGSHVRAEQKSLLAPASAEDLKGIYDHRDDPRISDIVQLIQKGQWEEFLDKYSDPAMDDAHYILLAAFCYSKEYLLSETELIDAFEFLSIAQEMGKGNYKICRMTDTDKFRLKLGPAFIQLSKEEMDMIPSHEQVGIAVRTQTIAPKEQDLVISEIQTNLEIFINFASDTDKACGYQFEAISNINGQKTLDTWTMCPSTSIVKRVIKDEENQQKLKPVLAFTERDDYLNDIKTGYSQIALLTPTTAKKTCVHGFTGEDKGDAVMRRLHDAMFHTLNRILNEIPKNEKLMKFIMALNETCKKQPELSVPLVSRGYIYPHLAEGATPQDLVTKLVLDFLGDIIDASANLNIDSSGNILDANKNLKSVENYVDTEWEKLIRINKPSTSPLVHKTQPITIWTQEMIETTKSEFKAIVVPILEHCLKAKNENAIKSSPGHF